MSTSRDTEAEDANITYPSPGAEAMEAGPFYNTGGREGAQDHQEHHEHHEAHHEPHHEQPEHHVPDQVQHVPVPEHDQGELPPPEPETPQQHITRPANLEELQLAAQLGQGLAGTSMMPTTDPNMNVEDPNLRSIMPHPEPDQQQTPSYVQDTPTTDPMVPHAMPVPVGPPMPPQYPIDNSIPPRKRSKVSRACDECRRKKIKCDAQSDTGEAPCSSCARSSIRCLFSRVPQKRGPSKGYIKELADRIHSIENKLESEGALSQDDIDRLFVSDRPRQSQGEDSNRKRPFSSISTNDFATPSRQTPWGSEHRIQPSPGTSEGYAPYSTGSLAPQPTAIKTDETPSKPPMAAMDITMSDTGEVTDVDEGMLHSYLSSVQPVYPILPSNKSRLQALLAQCPSSVQTAFVNALPAVTSSGGDTKLASALLNEWESNEASHTQATNIVHAQALLLLIIDADWRSSPTLPFLLARAVALANSMKLWRYTPMESASEPDSDDQLCVRIWWSLILMDRWYAAGTGKPAQIPDSSVVAPPGLENMLGEVCFYLVRLSKLLNRVSHVVSTLQPGASTTEEPMAAILVDYIENYREDLPAHIEPASHPMVHLAYWHCKLLVTLLRPGATPAETMWPTKELVNLLFANGHLRSPLVNHFASLVSMSLTKLCKIDSSREEATQLIKDIAEKPPGIWDGVRDKLSEQTRPTSSVEATASQGLQHLADLATAHEGIAPGGDDIAFGPSLASGYLDVA
ncbi:Zn(2)-C6 fungal-type domain-containing protein [Fusarium keratoplasticum]|uniref:Zn(2)-C6 fungal-type domain-containing protein n=1 Tax=Fusarium keratoplasticum TaxID=1328300 RepID=A0ACC0R5I8_9HYPO|nr:Zn(2)-C6 fungal-type domain-containing protein [Fusarium keratoplasticum]KAI8674837.1 Zn(2)-C6 fungal-type domain-containing protein [Fusarium keratoplasticum]KAI8681301.1 Zn(2)-C6 fungal-type domain-containing protein [Fusarium keratoplasticum]